MFASWRVKLPPANANSVCPIRTCVGAPALAPSPSRYALSRALNWRSAVSAISAAMFWSRAQRLGDGSGDDRRRAVVERVALRGDQPERAARVAKLPARVIEIAARRRLRQPLHVRGVGLAKQRVDERRRLAAQIALGPPTREQGHGT